MSIKRELVVRLIVVEPLAGVTYAVQRGRSELLLPVMSDEERLVFEFPVIVADLHSEPPRLTGKYAHGPPAERFVYVNSGLMAGQEGSCWNRRAKVPLGEIARALIEEATVTSPGVLEASISGTARDGGPACATVPLQSKWLIAVDT